MYQTEAVNIGHIFTNGVCISCRHDALTKSLRWQQCNKNESRDCGLGTVASSL